MNQTAVFNDLVKSLYLASAGLEDINQCLQNACRLFRSNVGIFLTTNTLDFTGQIPVGIGMSEQHKKLYGEEFAQDNPVLKACLPALMAGKVANSSDYFTDSEIEKLPYYHEFLKKIDVFYNAGFVVGSQGDSIYALNMARKRSSDTLSTGELRLMAALKPHAEAALDIGAHINQLKSESQSKSSVLDKMTVGVCFLDARLKIIEANLIARQILSDGVMLRSVNGHLESGRAAQSCMQQALASLRRGIRSSCRLKLNSSGPSCFMSVFPVMDADTFSWVDAKETRYMLFIGAELKPGQHCKQFLAREFGLTDRELELVSMVVGGSTLVRAAKHLQISHETARAHLKKVFLKMGIHSQSELAVTVSRLNSIH
jgi:DNA-binding CsgD family transcriptional regulator